MGPFNSNCETEKQGNGESETLKNKMNKKSKLASKQCPCLSPFKTTNSSTFIKTR